MVKVILICLLNVSLYSNIFDNNCMSCHKSSIQLKVFMKRYTLKYSSESKIKDAIFRYLKAPTQNRSIMPFGFIQRWGFKDESLLSDNELKNAINIYYENYNLKQYIK